MEPRNGSTRGADECGTLRAADATGQAQARIELLGKLALDRDTPGTCRAVVGARRLVLCRGRGGVCSDAGEDWLQPCAVELDAHRMHAARGLVLAVGGVEIERAAT